jgi:hypothetical protein
MVGKVALAIASTYVFGHWLAGLAVAVLFLVWDLLHADEGPPVLALAIAVQWFQVSGGVFYTGLTGRSLPVVELAEYETMVLIGLGCVASLALGLWAGRRYLGSRLARPDYAPEEVVGLRLLLIAYAGTLVVNGVLQEMAWRMPTLTQAIIALSYAHLGLVFLLLRRFTRPALQRTNILILLAVEVGLGFTGYFSNFKEPLLLAGLALLEIFDRQRREHWFAVAALVTTISIASLMWMGVRTKYREDWGDSAFAASRGVRFERMQALLTDWLSDREDRMQTDMDKLVDRSWAIYYPALAIGRVPSVLPHTHGELLGGALYHLVTPRVLFPDKPDLQSDSELVRKYSGIWVAGIERETSIAFGYAAESYVDFGIPVMFVPVLLFGVFCGAMYEVILRTLHHRELAVSLVTVVFWMSLYLFERSWPKTLGQSITMMVYLGGMCFLIDRWLLMRADKLPDETAVTRAGALADGQALR